MAPRKAIDDDCSFGVESSQRLMAPLIQTYTMDALARSLSLPTLSGVLFYCPKHQPGTTSRSALSHSSPSLPHPPISGALPLRAPAARPTGDQQVRRPRAQLTAASSKVSTPRSSYLQIGVSCLICFRRNFLPISVFAFGLNTSDCEA